MNKIRNSKNFRLIRITIIVLLFYVFLNTIAYFYSPFADFYTYHIFSTSQNIFSRFTSPIPFALGNILAYCYIYVIPICLIAFIIIIIFVKCVRKILTNILIKFICYNLIIVLGLFLFNDTIIYHSSNLSKIYFNTYNKSYSVDDLYNLGKKIVIEIGKVAPSIAWDENGNIVLPNNLEELSISALKSISSKYHLLKGYYPNAKVVTNYPNPLSALGKYFPYTLEATYKNYNDIDTPTIITHEYSHLKGFIKEDEATFISIIAGINSNNDILKYSAYLKAYDYISLALLILDEEKYYSLNEMYIHIINEHTPVESDYLNNYTYDQLSNYKYFAFLLDSFKLSSYNNSSSFIKNLENLENLTDNSDAIHIKYIINNNNESAIYDNIDLLYLNKENDNAYLSTVLFIDMTNISKDDYNKIYNLIYNNYKSFLNFAAAYSTKEFVGDFTTFIKQYEKLRDSTLNKNNDTDFVSEKERKHHYNFYMTPNTENKFFDSLISDDYGKAVRLLLEYNDNE